MTNVQRQLTERAGIMIMINGKKTKEKEKCSYGTLRPRYWESLAMRHSFAYMTFFVWHTHTRTYTHSHTHQDKKTQTHTHTHTHSLTYTHLPKHLNTHTYTHGTSFSCYILSCAWIWRRASFFIIHPFNVLISLKRENDYRQQHGWQFVVVVVAKVTVLSG